MRINLDNIERTAKLVSPVRVPGKKNTNTLFNNKFRLFIISVD